MQPERPVMNNAENPQIAFKIDKIYTEYQENPMGLDVLNPGFFLEALLEPEQYPSGCLSDTGSFGYTFAQKPVRKSANCYMGLRQTIYRLFFRYDLQRPSTFSLYKIFCTSVRLGTFRLSGSSGRLV